MEEYKKHKCVCFLTVFAYFIHLLPPHFLFTLLRYSPQIFFPIFTYSFLFFCLSIAEQGMKSPVTPTTAFINFEIKMKKCHSVIK